MQGGTVTKSVGVYWPNGTLRYIDKEVHGGTVTKSVEVHERNLNKNNVQ